jgi:hypothetical protein
MQIEYTTPQLHVGNGFDIEGENGHGWLGRWEMGGKDSAQTVLSHSTESGLHSLLLSSIAELI